MVIETIDLSIIFFISQGKSITRFSIKYGKFLKMTPEISQNRGDSQPNRFNYILEKEYETTYCHITFSGHNSPLSTRACQPTAGLKSICPQVESNDHPASMELMCDQHAESPNICWFPDRNCRFKPIVTHTPVKKLLSYREQNQRCILQYKH